MLFRVFLRLAKCLCWTKGAFFEHMRQCWLLLGNAVVIRVLADTYNQVVACSYLKGTHSTGNKIHDVMEILT